MLAVALGLGSSLCWGLADFFGGLQSRKRAMLAVLLVSQGVALLLLLPFAVALADESPSASAVGWAALGGSAGVMALGCFYRGLAIGTMSVVAPISATGAAVPVLVGLAEGERPGALQIAGMAAALVGVILASRECEPAEDLGAEHRNAGRAAIGLALVAALGFGTFFVGVDKASATAEVPWVIVISRSMLARARADRRARRPPGPAARRRQLRRARHDRDPRPRGQRALRPRHHGGAALGRRRARLALPGRHRGARTLRARQSG